MLALKYFWLETHLEAIVYFCVFRIILIFFKVVSKVNIFEFLFLPSAHIHFSCKSTLSSYK